MQSIAECYKKVSKDCFKFIKSQETSKEKFKNKEKTPKYYLSIIEGFKNKGISFNSLKNQKDKRVLKGQAIIK